MSCSFQGAALSHLGLQAGVAFVSGETIFYGTKYSDSDTHARCPGLNPKRVHGITSTNSLSQDIVMCV